VKSRKSLNQVNEPWGNIDNSCEDEKKNWRVMIEATLFQETLTITSKKLTVQPADAFEDTAFKPCRVSNCQILNYLVKVSALHTFVK
jgi:hypothetical protein